MQATIEREGYVRPKGKLLQRAECLHHSSASSMYLLNKYDSTSGVGIATGMDPTTVASWAGYNIGASSAV